MLFRRNRHSPVDTLSSEARRIAIRRANIPDPRVSARGRRHIFRDIPSAYLAIMLAKYFVPTDIPGRFVAPPSSTRQIEEALRFTCATRQSGHNVVVRLHTVELQQIDAATDHGHLRLSASPLGDHTIIFIVNVQLSTHWLPTAPHPLAAEWAAARDTVRRLTTLLPKSM